MPINQVPPGDTEIQKWFIDVPAVEPGVFEFALVLGGTVSAGAYTAGAVDFLVEALDCLSKAQHEGRAPQHKVRLKLIAGTSGAASTQRSPPEPWPMNTRTSRAGRRSEQAGREIRCMLPGSIPYRS